MSDKKVSAHDKHNAKRQEIGRVHNEQPPTLEEEIPVEEREIGRINNEQNPKHRQHSSPNKQEIGVIHNEKRD